MDGVRSAPPGRITPFWTPSPDCVRCGGLHPGLFSIPTYGRKGRFRPVDASSRIKRANEVRSCDRPGICQPLWAARHLRSPFLERGTSRILSSAPQLVAIDAADVEDGIVFPMRQTVLTRRRMVSSAAKLWRLDRSEER